MTKYLPQCLVKNCTGIKSSRGLCSNHYTKILKCVNRGQYTWEELVKKGLVLESNRMHSKDGMPWEVKTPEEMQQQKEE